jgi:hypothetical protein
MLRERGQNGGQNGGQKNGGQKTGGQKNGGTKKKKRGRAHSLFLFILFRKAKRPL